MTSETAIPYPPPSGSQFLDHRDREVIIGSQLGRPGFRGIAYLAQFQSTHLVVKIPNIDPDDDRRTIEKRLTEIHEDFRREKAASDQLSTSPVSNRVCRSFHIGKKQFELGDHGKVTMPYLIREKVDAEALDKWVTSLGEGHFAGLCNISTWAAMGSDLAAVIAAMHESGVVHCDIRPANIRVVPRTDHIAPQLMLIDFGQSRVKDSDDSHFWSSDRKPYYPPERVWGKWDHRADIYALGGVLYYLATGNEPPSPFVDPRMDDLYFCDTANRLLRSHDDFLDCLRTQLEEFGSFAASELSSVVDIVSRCLHPYQEDRISNAKHVVKMINECVA